MDKPSLLKRLDQMIDEAERTKLWGTIEVSFQNGVATIFRKITTERLTSEGGNPHEYRNERR
jgi:hypothetical protein